MGKGYTEEQLKALGATTSTRKLIDESDRVYLHMRYNTLSKSEREWGAEVLSYGSTENYLKSVELTEEQLAKFNKIFY